MSIESGRLWTFGKGGRLSSKPRRRAVQIYNHKAAVEYAKAKRRDQLGTSGAAGSASEN